ncbi:hypothetical protein FRB91_000044 [Serendipita sp. 411]|nr:hypothetical protein FRC18_003936 [Serendipita sp. 400]KAG8861801.1 hypothetical protein FRB91_000044 [Serendipita sp. 411]
MTNATGTFEDPIIVVVDENTELHTAETEGGSLELEVPDLLDEDPITWSGFRLASFEEVKDFYERLSNTSDAESIATPAPTTPASTQQTLEEEEGDNDGDNNLFEEEDVGVTDEGLEEILSLGVDDVVDQPDSEEALATLIPLEGNAGSSSTMAPTISAQSTSITAGPSSTSRRKRVLLAHKVDDGVEPELGKIIFHQFFSTCVLTFALERDAEGYVAPLAIYMRLRDKANSLKTESLDRLVAPPEDASTKDFELGTITCHMRRKIANGVWKDREIVSCGAQMDRWDSYRRHLLRSDLDLPRGSSLSKALGESESPSSYRVAFSSSCTLRGKDKGSGNRNDVVFCSLDVFLDV